MAMEVRRKVDVDVEVETEADFEVEVETEASNTPPLLLVLPSPVGHAHSPCHSTPLETALPLSQCTPLGAVDIAVTAATATVVWS